MTKYGNKKVMIDGILFASKREARRYMELRTLQRCGIITGLELQQPFEIIPSVRINGRKCAAVKYVADFVYYENGKMIVEDSKGCRTRDYVIKKKLMKHVHRIEIRET